MLRWWLRVHSSSGARIANLEKKNSCVVPRDPTDKSGATGNTVCALRLVTSEILSPRSSPFSHARRYINFARA